MATDLAALMSQKRNLELSGLSKGAFRTDQAALKRRKTTRLDEDNEEEISQMRILSFNLYDLITKDRRPEELARARSPMNAIYLYESSLNCQEMFRQGVCRVMFDALTPMIGNRTGRVRDGVQVRMCAVSAEHLSP